MNVAYEKEKWKARWSKMMNHFRKYILDEKRRREFLKENFKRKRHMQIKRQSYLNRLINKKGNGLIKVVTGVRRCGKSYLLFNLFHEHLFDEGVDESHIIEIALDDRTNIKLRNPDNMLEYVKGRITDKDTYYIILDEVQLLDGFEDVLNSFLHIRNADVYVTGSNSKFLSSDVITEFRGS